MALSVALSWPLLSFGQMRGAAATAPGIARPQMGISGGLTISFGPSRGPTGHPFHHSFFPTAFFFDPYWYEPPVVTSAPRPVVVVPIELMRAEQPREEAKAAEPLLIERRGDRFVRTRGGDNAQATTTGDVESHDETSRAHFVQLPPAVLVFRDGHREQTSNYAIVGDRLYLYFDYADGGAWFKKIGLSDLDLVATAAANREIGSNFHLPRGPNEIVVRP